MNTFPDHPNAPFGYVGQDLRTAESLTDRIREMIGRDVEVHLSPVEYSC